VTEPLVVEGEIELPRDSLGQPPARIIVVLEDVSRADAPSRVIAAQDLGPRAFRAGEHIPFRLPAGAVDAKHMYSVRVHVDISGSGEVERGDYVSTDASHRARAAGVAASLTRIPLVF